MFPDKLILVEVAPIYKNNDKKDKGNYRPISIFTKIYKRCIQALLNEYFLSKLQSGIRQRFSTQHCLLAMIEKLIKITITDITL